MDVDTPLLDEPPPPEDKPLPYTVPPGPRPYPVTSTWADLFAEAIRASHEHKLSIGDMIRYIATVYPGLKGSRAAAGAMFNTKLAQQTGKSNMVPGTVVDEAHAKYTKTHAGPRFVRVTGN